MSLKRLPAKRQRYQDDETMTALTRRRDPSRPEETWLIFYGDVHGCVELGAGQAGAIGTGALEWRPRLTPGDWGRSLFVR
jgi:hypothetical protein